MEMGGLLKLEIITPEKTAESCFADQVTLPGSEGQFCVLPGHAALIGSLEIGELNFTSQSKKTYYAVNRGFAQVLNNKVTVLVETAERADHIDKERARRAMSRTEGQLVGTARDDQEYARLKAALLRAVSRLKVAQRA